MNQKIVFLLMCMIIASSYADVPEILPEEAATPAEQPESPTTEKKYKIRCRGGKCRFKGGRKRKIPTDGNVTASLKKIASTPIAKGEKPSTFKVNCTKGKCNFKRKGLGRRKYKVRCKGNVCRIKGKRRLGAKPAQRIEAYRKSLERRRQQAKAPNAQPETYKVQCKRDRCELKKKWAGKKRRGNRRRHRGRRGQYRRRQR